MKHSAGIFLFNSQTRDFLIVHPAGAYNKKAPWHIPKGELSAGSDPADIDHLKAEAIRELNEETGIELGVETELVPLGSRKYKSGSKTVHAFFAQIAAPRNPEIKLDAENDQFRWVKLEELGGILHEAQASFVEKLQTCVA